MTPLGAFFTFLLGSAAAGVLLRLAKPWAERRGWVDRPGGRKSQARAVALVGGVALLGGIAVGAACGAFAGASFLTPSLVALATLFLVGLADDTSGKGMRVRTKSLLTAAVLLAFAGPPHSLTDAALLLAAFVVLHSFNTSDNMNGLAPGLALAGVPAVLALLPGGEGGGLATGLAGALAVFLVWNFPGGRVYLGDSGSLLLGGWFALTLLESRHPALLCCAAVPVADLVTVGWLRWRQGVPPWRGDRGHWSHRLAARGLGEVRAVLWLWGVQLLCNALGLVLLLRPGLPGAWEVLAALVLLAGASAAALATARVPGSAAPSVPPCEGEPLGSR